MIIDKSTILCGSFAKEAGSFGCFVHNNAFNYLNLNYIYKSFSISKIDKAVEAIRTLNIRGIGVTMPYKKSVISFLDKKSICINEIGACNTIVNKKGILYGENTDFLGVRKYLLKIDPPESKVTILGTGGMSLAVQAVCKNLNIEYIVIERKKLEKIKDVQNSYIFNATPLVNLDICKTNKIIHANVSTERGMLLAILQASFQFNLYTNSEFPISYIIECVNKKFKINVNI